MVSCMYIFHHCTLRFEGNKYIIIIIIIIRVEEGVRKWTIYHMLEGVPERDCTMMAGVM